MRTPRPVGLPFVLAHAVRESRSSWKKIGLYMTSITLGVAALVAINSFRASLLTSVETESRTLLGADLRLSSSRPFTPRMQSLIDSAGQRFEVSTVTNLVSMAAYPAAQKVRLVQLRAVSGGFPYYGSVVTQPAGVWQLLERGRWAVVDPALLAQLEVQVGDTIYVGQARFTIAGTIVRAPGDFTLRTAIGPRVAIGGEYLKETGLERFGTMSQRQVFVRIADEKTLETFVDRRHKVFRENLVDYDTAKEQSDNLGEALDALTRFLGLVGLAALLLGGVGVASAVHVFIKEKRPIVATLRCLGATQATVFSAYLIQAAALGFAGALAGALLGLAVQALLPTVLRDVLPLNVAYRIDPWAVLAGLGVGVWVAALFALLPLLAIRGISPLQALRREYEAPKAGFDWLRAAAYLALAFSIVGISFWQAADYRPALAFSGGLGVSLGMLWLTAWLLARATRTFFPRRANFVLRQGVGSLFRPHNQTVAVILGLGFGVFVIGTVYLVQRNLLGWLRIENSPDAPNMVAFDIQRDQVAGVQMLARAQARAAPEITPIVPARVTHLKGMAVDRIMRDSMFRRIEPWALRREYRHTYRDTLVSSEKIIAGQWFGPNAGKVAPYEVSIEEDIANDLDLKLGDRVTWDFQGVAIETRVTSIRKVDWGRFATNFFFVFPKGVLDNAPQQFVAMMRVDSPDARAALQREIVQRHSNVTVIDVAQVQASFEEIIGKVTLAVRFMALFSTLAGIIVLIGAVATSRFQRMREAVLLKTLGATRNQILGILITEYAALGLLAGLTGLSLAGLSGWLLMKFFFELDFALPVAAMLGTWIGVAALALLIGLLNSVDLLRKPPLAVLREAD